MTAVTLVVGDEEFLVERALRRAVTVAGAELTTCRDVTAADLDADELAGLLSPSLFDDVQGLILRGIQDASKELASALTSVASDPGAVVLALSHAGGVKGKALLESLTGAGVQRVDIPRIRSPRDREQFVVDEVRDAGAVIDRDAAADLVAAVGGDLRELATACVQLISDVGPQIGSEQVAAYYRGRAESTGYAVADRAVEGDAGAALETLRWAMATGLDPVLVSSSLAANLRTIALVGAAGRGSPDALAGRLGMPAWKIRRTQGWLRRWRPESLAEAVAAVATADADIKGAGDDAAYAAERAVIAVASQANR